MAWRLLVAEAKYTRGCSFQRGWKWKSAEKKKKNEFPLSCVHIRRKSGLCIRIARTCQKIIRSHIRFHYTWHEVETLYIEKRSAQVGPQTYIFRVAQETE